MCLSDDASETLICQLPKAINTIVDSDTSVRSFDLLVRKIYQTLQARDKAYVWKALKPYLQGAWNTLGNLRSELNLNDISRQEAGEIFSRIEREGSMIETKKEQSIQEAQYNMEDLALDDDNQILRKGIDELFFSVQDYALSPKFKELLDFTAHFKRYAPYNAMLIHIQNPGARFVLPARSWQKYNRVVINDRRPLVILWPFAPVHYVYDVGDTMVIPGELDKFEAELAKPYDGDPTRQVSEKHFRKLIDNLKYWGIFYEEMRTGEIYSGKLEVGQENDPSLKFRREDKCPMEWRPAYSIRVSMVSSISVKFSAILHELGHLFCNHLPNCYNQKKRVDITRRLSHVAKEFEAETVSWLVCKRLGVDNPSYKYLAQYCDSHATIPNEVSVDEILKAPHLAEQVLHGCPLERCYLYTKSPEFKKATDEYRACLKKNKNSVIQLEFEDFNR